MSRDEIIAFAKEAFANIFGWVGREPSESDIGMFSRWFNEYGFPPDLVEYAMSMAARSTEYNRMKYAELVVQDFHKRGIKTVEAVEEMLKSRQPKPGYQKSGGSSYTAGGQRTVQVPVREDKKIQTPSAKMRPCPFCGYEGIYLVIQNSSKFNTKYVVAECGQCEAGTKSIGIHYDVPDNVVAETLPEGQQVIELWNTRV